MKKRRERTGVNTLEEVVRALCADYDRRNECIEQKTVSRRVRMEYAYINARMLEAAHSVCGSEIGTGFIEDIGRGRGYAKSDLAECFSEKLYKTKKTEVIMSIARSLHLADK